MAAKFFTGLPLDGPDPECVLGHGEHSLSSGARAAAPRSSPDHSRRPRSGVDTPSGASGGGVAGSRVPIALLPRRPDRSCDESPLAGFVPGPPVR